MHFAITRILQIILCYFGAQIVTEAQAIYIAIPLLAVCLDIALKLWTGRGLLFHLFNV